MGSPLCCYLVFLGRNHRHNLPQHVLYPQLPTHPLGLFRSVKNTEWCILASWGGLGSLPQVYKVFKGGVPTFLRESLANQSLRPPAAGEFGFGRG